MPTDDGSMKTWLIKPHDAVLFRDARPFKAGARARTMPLPWPSTIAGFVRSRIGRDARGDFVMPHDEARAIGVRGPWVVALDDDTGRAMAHYFPAPLDAIFFAPEGEEERAKLMRRRLGPLARPQDLITDLDEALHPIGFLESASEHFGKPTAGPALWTLGAYREWLGTPAATARVSPSDVGIAHMPTRERIHVGIDPTKLTASEGDLFQTSMLEATSKAPHGDGFIEYGFGVMLASADAVCVEDGGADVIGGERRIAHIFDDAALDWPAPTIHSKLARVALLTPGLFRGGALPARELDGATLVGARVGRGTPLSGWSFEHQGPKPTRLMVAAGSVYWYALPEGREQAWVDAHHMTSLCDDAQDGLDGFGLVAIGEGGERP